jgi:hypothetical protein
MSVKRMARKALSMYGSPGGWVLSRPKKQPVGRPMGCLNGLLVRSLDQAKAALRALFEPVGDETHAESVLNLQITHVGCCNVGSGRVGEIVAIHVEGHR